MRGRQGSVKYGATERGTGDQREEMERQRKIVREREKGPEGPRNRERPAS